MGGMGFAQRSDTQGQDPSLLQEEVHGRNKDLANRLVLHQPARSDGACRCVTAVGGAGRDLGYLMSLVHDLISGQAVISMAGAEMARHDVAKFR